MTWRTTIAANPYVLAAQPILALIWRFLPWVLAGLLAFFAFADLAIKGPLGIGFHFEGWRPKAERLEAEAEAAEKARQQAYQAEAERRATIATEYEREAANAAQVHTIREREIQTIFRDVLVPAECAAPDAVQRVLAEAVAGANAAATGEPVRAVPAAAEPAEPAD